MFRFQTIFTIMAVLLIYSLAAADTVTVSGRIVDESGNPVSLVNVRSRGIAKTAVSDDSGRFVIAFSGKSPALVTFSHTGYIPQTIKVAPDAGELTVRLEKQIYPMQGVTVTAGRAIPGYTPVASETKSREEIERDYDFDTFPTLLETTPNLHAYSDAGGGLGYSYIRMRGFDARRVPVYINGVPLNDPEDHAVYFVDLPDFASNVDNIQVQRGVGNAQYADGAFGGSVNILTSPFDRPRQVVAEFGYGGFIHDNAEDGRKRKSLLSFNSGLLDGGWSLSGRLSNQFSDGYRYQSWYKGSAYYLSLGRVGQRSITTVNFYGGPMRTHAAWWGSTREELARDHRHNPYTYPNELDNFDQPHVELHNIYSINANTKLFNTLYYIRGNGYYQEFISGAYDGNLFVYNLSDDPNTTESTDLVRRQWVDKDQYGINSRISFEGRSHKTQVGLSYYFFNSDHWGEVLWAQEANPSLQTLDAPVRYYENFAKYHNASVFASRSQRIMPRVTLFGDLQFRFLNIDFNQTPLQAFPGYTYDVNWFFFSPRTGVRAELTDNLSAFASFSVASHEPNQIMLYEFYNPYVAPNFEVVGNEDGLPVFGDPKVDPERVYDYEIGADFRSPRLSFDVNLYWMEFENELIQAGKIDAYGNPIFANADGSVHRGIETSASYAPLKELSVEGNYAYNDNVIRAFDQEVDGETISYRDIATPGFPRFLSNLIVDYHPGPWRFVYHLRGVGRQFVDLTGSRNLSVAPYAVSALKGGYTFHNLFGAATVTIEARVDNLFNRRYEQYGVYWQPYSTAYYWPAAERNWFVNMKLAVF